MGKCSDWLAFCVWLADGDTKEASGRMHEGGGDDLDPASALPSRSKPATVDHGLGPAYAVADRHG